MDNYDGELFTISVPDMIAELEREAIMRRKVYPNLVRQKKMSEQMMTRKIAIIEALISKLRDGG